MCVNLTLAVSWTRTYYACFLVCRFAQFFICPLLSPEATSREIHAVDSGIEFCFLLFEEPFSSPLCSSVFQHFKSFYCYVTLFLLIYGTIWIWIEVLWVCTLMSGRDESIKVFITQEKLTQFPRLYDQNSKCQCSKPESTISLGCRRWWLSPSVTTFLSRDPDHCDVLTAFTVCCIASENSKNLSSDGWRLGQVS